MVGTMTAVGGLLVDIDGVLVVSWEALPGAGAALAALRAAQLPIRFVTNTTSKTRDQITGALRAAGFDVDPTEVLTAAAATDSLLALRYPGARCLLLNSGDIASDLTSVELVDGDRDDDVDVVVIGGAGPEFSYAQMNRAFRCVLGGAGLVGMHRNLSWRTSEGMQLDGGAYLAALERATGIEATVVGKPAPAMFEAGLRDLGLPADRVVMVGDDLENDVLAAMAVGVTGVLVRTGKFRPEVLARAGPAPTVVLDSFADVPAWLGVV